MRKVHIYTDGFCDVHDPDKPGGWAAILVDIRTGRDKQISGSRLKTTSGAMEIRAAVEGLSALRGGPYDGRSLPTANTWSGQYPATNASATSACCLNWTT